MVMGVLSWARCHGRVFMGVLSWARCHGRVVMGVAKSLFSSGDSSCPPSPSRTQTALHCVCVYVCVSRACVHGGVRACVRACVCVCVCVAAHKL